MFISALSSINSLTISNFPLKTASNNPFDIFESVPLLMIISATSLLPPKIAKLNSSWFIEAPLLMGNLAMFKFLLRAAILCGVR